MSLKNYLEKGKLRRVKPKSDQVIRLIKRAKKDLDTAEYNLDVDPEWEFTILQFGKRKILEAKSVNRPEFIDAFIEYVSKNPVIAINLL